MSLSRCILSNYRKVQYKLYGRYEIGIMPEGRRCYHTPFEEDINHGDVVHPCVRYIPEGYLGHKWWMVYTPYYAANDQTENPILCYGKDDSDEPPINWIVAFQVQKQPKYGYNSDPTLVYYEEKLYVMWRENNTPRCNKYGFARASFGAIIDKKGMGNVFGPLVGTKFNEIDHETSPTFMFEKDGSIRCLAMHLKFRSSIMKSAPNFILKYFNLGSNLLDILGIWSQQKSYGIAIWHSESINTPFKYIKTISFKNKNKLYRPWHMDFFEHSGKLYSIVQSNQCNADILLAYSDDGEHFKFYNKPLMTNATCKKVGIYKPTAGIVNNNFYMYYTAQEPLNRKLNVLYLTVMPFKKLLSEIE